MPIELPGTLRSPGKPDQSIWFSQISANGCKITGVTENSALDSEVEVELGPIGIGLATVRWAQADAIGVQFHQPLHPVIVDYFRSFLANAA